MSLPMNERQQALMYILAILCDDHGTTAVIEALRDACHVMRDSHGACVTVELWQKAGDAMSFAVDDVRRAEDRAVGGAKLADGLRTLAVSETP